MKLCSIDGMPSGASVRSGAARSGGSAPVDAYAENDDAPEPVAKKVRPSATDPQFDAPSRETAGRSAPAPAKTPHKLISVFGEVDGAPHAGAGPAGDAGLQQHTSIDQGYDADVAIDPTGRWIVFASTRHNDAPDIYLQRTDGTSVTQLTSDSNPDAYPTFNRAGTQIAFCSCRGGSWQIYVMDVDGRNASQVTSGPMQAVHPSFSPDGRRICYMALGGRSNQWEIWTANLQTSEKKMIGYGLFPAWSPDPAKDCIAFQRAPQRGSRQFSLWTMDVVDGEGRRITEVAASANAAIVSPAWSPDGKRLAFGTVASSLPAAGGKAPRKSKNVAGAQQDIWTVNADGTHKRKLTDSHSSSLQPAWASNGRIFFISNRSGVECVWSVQADDGPPLMADATKRPAPAGETQPTPEGPADSGAGKVDPFANADTQDAVR